MRTTVVWRLMAAAMFVSLGAIPAQAAEPPAVDVAGGYVFLAGVGYGNTYPSGWLASVGVSVTPVVSVVGEIGGSYDNNPGIAPGIPDLNASFYNFMGGPRVASHRNRAFTPFAQVLVGDIRVGNNLGGYVHNFSWQPGGGIDIALTRALGLRLQGDYRLIWVGGILKQFRVTTGIVFRR